jgi:HD-like signal output (HDOD) protein
MMLRLGEINLGQARPFCVPQIEAKPIQPGERWVRQRQLIGFDEGQITAELVRHWDFPESLIKGLRHASQPLVPTDFRKLAAVLHVAARLADGGAVTPQTISDLPVILLKMLSLDPEMLLLDAPDASELADVSMFAS